MAKDADGNVIPDLYEGSEPTFAEIMEEQKDWVYYTDANGEFKYGPRPESTYYEVSEEEGIAGGQGLKEGYDPASYEPTPEFRYVGEEQTYTPPAREPDDIYTPPIVDPVDPFDPGDLYEFGSGGDGGGEVEEEREFKDWTGGGNQKDTSWDWDSFAPKREGDNSWGGFDEDYGVFERYQPGMDSPWGMPDVEGGNEEFYQQQFNNLLRDEQGYQSRERAAQEIRQDALDNPQQVDPFDWSVVNAGQGLPEVSVSGGGIPEGVNADDWVRNDTYDLTKGMTNQQAVNSMNAIWNDDESAMWSEHWADPAADGDATYWLSDEAGLDPNNILSGFKNVSPEFGSVIQKFINNAWGQAGDVYSGGVPEGYAAPIAAPT